MNKKISEKDNRISNLNTTNYTLRQEKAEALKEILQYKIDIVDLRLNSELRRVKISDVVAMIKLRIEQEFPNQSNELQQFFGQSVEYYHAHNFATNEYFPFTPTSCNTNLIEATISLMKENRFYENSFADIINSTRLNSVDFG